MLNKKYLNDSKARISQVQWGVIYIYVGLKSGLWWGVFNEFSLELAIAVIQWRVY